MAAEEKKKTDRVEVTASALAEMKQIVAEDQHQGKVVRVVFQGYG